MDKIYISNKKIEIISKQGFYSNELRSMGFDFDKKYDDLIDRSFNNETRRLKLISIAPEYKYKINYAFSKLKEKKETKLSTLIKLRILSGIKDHCRQNDIFIKSMCRITLEQIIGYSLENLMNYLKIFSIKDIKNKEIDHIIPKSKFNFKSIRDSDFIECWKLSNLRLIDKNENRKKWNKYAT